MDGGFTQAAAISYYLVVSIFPMLLILIGIMGYWLRTQEIRTEVLGWLSQYFPPITRVVFQENLQSLIEVSGQLSLMGIVVLLWSCTLMFDAINQAINAAWGMRGNSRFFLDKFKSLVLISIIVAAALVSIFLTTRNATPPPYEEILQAFPFLQWPLDLGREASGILLPFFLNVCAFGLAYRLLPRVRISIKDVWPAAFSAAILWEASKRGFVWYLTEHAAYRQIYGSISTVLVLMIWAYVTSLILAWGAELTAEIWKERRKVEPGAKGEYPYVGFA
ncbi:MAG: YihY/virulence factor BrkB family protein [Acidobacteriota bacterium]